MSTVSRTAGRAAALAAALALALAGCSIPEVDLDGKQCPCASGWTCATATNTCVREPGAIDAADGTLADAGDAAPADATDAAALDAIDAPVIDAIDAPPPPTCLGSAPGATLYSDDFADLIGWVTVGGTWSATAMEAVQSSTASNAAYLYPAGTSAFTSYRVKAQLRRLGGATAGAMQLAVRLQAGNDGQYACAWQPGTGALQLQWVRTNGGVGGTLAQAQVNIGAIPGYDPAAPVTMEVQASGSQLTCCLREHAAATVTATDTRYSAGAPALRTASLSAGFRDFVVSAP